jgi:hypothetical protein
MAIVSVMNEVFTQKANSGGRIFIFSKIHRSKVEWGNLMKRAFHK